MSIYTFIWSYSWCICTNCCHSISSPHRLFFQIFYLPLYLLHFWHCSFCVVELVLISKLFGFILLVKKCCGHDFMVVTFTGWKSWINGDRGGQKCLRRNIFTGAGCTPVSKFLLFGIWAAYKVRATLLAGNLNVMRLPLSAKIKGSVCCWFICKSLFCT